VGNRQRLLPSPWLFIALAAVLGLNASSASAGSTAETRVRANKTVTDDSVGPISRETPGGVGCLRPATGHVVVGSCVATNNDGEQIAKATSPVWQCFQSFRGKTKTNGQSGSKKEFYEWHFTHCDIEVYDKNCKHKGTMDPMTGEMIKPAIGEFQRSVRGDRWNSPVQDVYGAVRTMHPIQG
jgi:hypothetical protein